MNKDDAAIQRLLAAEPRLKERLRRWDEGGEMSDEQIHWIEMPPIKDDDPDAPIPIWKLGVAGAMMADAWAGQWKKRAERWKKMAKYEYADHGKTLKMLLRLRDENDLLAERVDALTAELTRKGKD